jgi:hypothetical protein
MCFSPEVVSDCPRCICWEDSIVPCKPGQAPEGDGSAAKVVDGLPRAHRRVGSEAQERNILPTDHSFPFFLFYRSGPESIGPRSQMGFFWGRKLRRTEWIVHQVLEAIWIRPFCTSDRGLADTPKWVCDPLPTVRIIYVGRSLQSPERYCFRHSCSPSG